MRSPHRHPLSDADARLPALRLHRHPVSGRATARSSAASSSPVRPPRLLRESGRRAPPNALPIARIQASWGPARVARAPARSARERAIASRRSGRQRGAATSRGDAEVAPRAARRFGLRASCANRKAEGRPPEHSPLVSLDPQLIVERGLEPQQRLLVVQARAVDQEDVLGALAQRVDLARWRR